MGGFHRAMNFMGDIGHLMQDSGFEDILVKSSLYGPSVVFQVMKGKAFNRGVRIHKLMKDAMHRLKWEECFEWMEKTDQNLSEEESEKIGGSIMKCLELLGDVHQSSNENFKTSQLAVKELMMHTGPLLQHMANFTEYGKSCSYTFTFWNSYLCDMSQLLLDYIAAKRDDNMAVEQEAFAEMSPYDFMCGHLNYAKWGTVNVAEGHILQEKKPHIYEALSKGNWSLHYTERPFSGVWHDMGIEQSLNKDCGKHRHLYTNETALTKCYLTAHLKAAMKQMSGIHGTKNALHKEESVSRMNRDEAAIQEIVKTVKERMINPFIIESGTSPENKQPLLNIATTAVVPNGVAESLCCIKDKGITEMDNFILSRLSSSDTVFFAPMKRLKLQTFSGLNKTLSKKKENIQQINTDRQIFSKLAVIAQSRDVDMQGIMERELAPVPLSLFKLDGSMRKTAKNMTLTWMEKDYAVDTVPQSEESTCFIVDFMMILRMICTDTSTSRTFGELSDTILAVILNHGYHFTAVVGDAYNREESIKSAERSRRGSVQMQEIYNPTRQTPLPKQQNKMLSNPRNKSNIADFIMKDWISQCEDKLSEGQQLYLSGGFKDPRRAVGVVQGGWVEIEELESDHEEADSWMFLHMNHAVESLHVRRFVLWSIDSDVAAMCPRFCVLHDMEELYFKRQRKRYIPMHTVADDIGKEMSEILPAVHALSGCDSTSAFSGIGKTKWMKCLIDNPDLVRGIQRLGEDASNVAEETVSSCVHLTSLVYGKKQKDSLDELRYELFCTKSANSEKLPPTMDAFKQHLKRANYQAFIWLHADQQFLNLPNATECGWTTNSPGHLIPRAMTKSPAPDALLIFPQCDFKGDCETWRCRCRREEMVCSDLCGCTSETCGNRLVTQFPDSDED